MKKQLLGASAAKSALFVALLFTSALLFAATFTVSDSDPDMPKVGVSIDRSEYLRLRAEHIAKLRGVEKGKRFDPGARGRAIQQLNRQEGRPENSIATITAGLGGSGSSATNSSFAAASLNSGSSTAPATAGSPSSTTVWSPIGPAPIPNGQTFAVVNTVSGRTTAIAIHPTNGNVAYAGAAQGGVYRTIDGGATWTPIFDNAQTLSIGAIAICPSQPSTIYVGTGEGNFSGDSFFGVGIYRIDNADSSNPILTGPLNKDANGNDVLSGWSIDKIIVHPTDPNTIFFGTTSGFGGISGDFLNDTSSTSAKPRGLFRSTNATSSTPTFSKIAVNGVLNGGNRSVTDIEYEPGNPNNMLLTVFGGGVAGDDGGVYRTTNAQAATPTFTRTLAAGSASAIARTEIATTKIGTTVYVFAATSDSSGNLKRSTDGGQTWSAALATGFCHSQCTYDMPIAVDPTDPNVVYLGGQDDNGSAHILTKVTNATGTPILTAMQTGLHGDMHAIETDPSNHNIVWVGNDGGIFKSTDGASTWTSLNNSTYNATQFQSITLHSIDSSFAIGGTQDNGTECLGQCGSNIGNTWIRSDYGDGGYALIDQSQSSLTALNMYHTYYNATNSLIGYAYVTNVANAQSNSWSFNGTGGSTCTDGGGFTCSEAVVFYAPMTLGPGSPNPVYFGTDRLHRWTSPGVNHTVVSQAPIVSGVPISAIGISPQSDGVRIVGLDNGQVWATTSGSSTLANITGTIPAKYIARAVIDPNNTNTAYVTLSGYFGNSTAHIYKTTNLNNAIPTWTGLDGGQIPDVPVNAFVIDPQNSNALYAGTDIGVYRSVDGGATWIAFSNGLPRVAVFDVAIQNPNRVLRIATHGRGIWEVSIAATPTPTPTPTASPTPTPTPTPTPPTTGPAVMLSPPPGSTFTSSSVTFTWSAGSATAYFLFVGSSLHGADIYNSGQVTVLSKTVNNIPTDGRTIYVTLGSQVNGSWTTNSYTYTAFK